jgi:hypothetical protein
LCLPSQAKAGSLIALKVPGGVATAVVPRRKPLVQVAPRSPERAKPMLAEPPRDPADLEGGDNGVAGNEGVGLDLGAVLARGVGVGVGADPGERHRGQTRCGSDQREDDG